MQELISLEDLPLENKKVFLRVDFNLPIVNGEITDMLRLESATETIRYLIQKNCRIILASHLGRPDGKVDPKLSLSQIVPVLSETLDRKIEFVDDCIGQKVKQKVDSLEPGDILLLENLRFYKQEEANDPSFAKELADLADIYIDDAFAAIHRAHASIVGVAELLPHAAGFLVEREYETLKKLMTDPDRPFVAIIGGAKVSTKIDVLNNLIGIVDGLVIAGAMANTFLTALGHDMGSSIMEKDYLTQAKQIYQEAINSNIKLILPKDFLVAQKIDEKADCHLANIDQIKPKEIALDVGPKTSQDISILVDQAKTVFWNGPLGYTEIDRFAAASIDLANTMIESSAQAIIGGGDSAAFVDKYHLSKKFDFVSTGGGASLELLAGKTLPGIEVLQK